MGKVHLAALTEKVAVAARSFFTACCNHAPRDSFYGLAVCPDSEVRSFYWMANSVESLQTKAEQWLATNRREHPEQDTTMEQALDLHRFEVADWHFHEDSLPKDASDCREANQLYREATGALTEALATYRGSWFRSALGVRVLCLEAIVEGLKRFDSGYQWAPKIDRNQFVLLVVFPAPDGPEQVKAARWMARKLNPPQSFATFNVGYEPGI
jgi:hypothetical protein